MKDFIICSLALLFTAGCTTNSLTEQVIDDVFLDVADTAAYYDYQFFPPPQAVPHNKKKSEYLLCVNQSLSNPSAILKSLDSVSLSALKPEIIKILHYGTQTGEDEFYKLAAQIGLYTIISAAECPEKNPNYVGKLKFYKALNFHSQSILLVEKSHKQKAGVLLLLLVEKNNKHWKIKEEVELQRW